MTRLCLSGKIAPAYAELFRRCMHLFAEARAGIMVSLFIHGILAVEQSIPYRQWVSEIIGHEEWRPLLIDLLLNQSGDKIKSASYPDPMFEWAVKALAPCRLKMPKTSLEDIIEQLDDTGAGGEIPSGCIMAEQRFTDIMVKVTWYEPAVYLVHGLYTPLYSDNSGKELDAFKAEIIQDAASAQNMAVLPIDAMLLWQDGVTRVTVPVRRITGRK